MKLQAVMETLIQRQQRARQELEARQPPPPPPPPPLEPTGVRARTTVADEDREPENARMHRTQMAALAAMRAAAAGLGHPSSPGGSEDGPPGSEDEDTAQEGTLSSPALHGRGREGSGHTEEDGHLLDMGFDDDFLLRVWTQVDRWMGPDDYWVPEKTGSLAFPLETLYELDADPKRKEFLDDLFSFMQKRGTPVNRIPIMAKQVLDLFMLYVLVTEKGGLVEVINKKLWREITKGLNLPTSITSAAFTLRTQYMKYLYPYECERRGLSSPNELQAAIDSNRREGRRQSFGGSLFAYSPSGAHNMLSSPKLPVTSLGLAASTNGSPITPAPKIKKEEDSAMPITRALQQNFLAMAAQLPMNIRINSQASESRQDSAVSLASANGSNSINMSVEMNGIVYTGVLFAQPPPPTPPSAPSKGSIGTNNTMGSRTGASSGTSSSQDKESVLVFVTPLAGSS
ncbi:AT-rich interactive domain-containing protein 3A [Cricetulus griseus]|uniref:AT-rich interactive domain-containing protein 3 n=1 Tax=Cricetulus griseus TaxID=10029 RepID=A0A061HYE6_CRIGR|nr:AT-rich interactive domain-containing protein 3A [Cricetulus griseus]